MRHQLPKKFYNHFLILHVAMSLLFKIPSLSDIAYAEELLLLFVKKCDELYGPESLSYNVHSLIHLGDDARKYGCLDNISAFPFENFLQGLKKKK